MKKMIRFTAFSFSLICVLMTPFAARAVTIPGGTTMLVRTVDQLSSSDKAGKSFAARLDVNLVVKGRVVIPAGSKVYGRVESSRSAGRAFGQSVTVASWKMRPSWFIGTTDDRVVSPELQAAEAKRMGARTTVLQSSHMSLLSHPEEVAKVIEDAAAAAVA